MILHVSSAECGNPRHRDATQPQPDFYYERALGSSPGRLLFSVRTPGGAEHDIDELSSGEKEVLYGYSVLLIDEPELHLNPRLIAGLASFYHRHLGRALGNQLWLVTHSDTLIREAVGQKGFSVFHMQPPGQHQSRNQASLVHVIEDVERLVVDLVGDLAAYRPGAKIVLFEGGGDSDFDLRHDQYIVSALCERSELHRRRQQDSSHSAV